MPFADIAAGATRRRARDDAGLLEVEDRVLMRRPSIAPCHAKSRPLVDADESVIVGGVAAVVPGRS